MRYAQALAVHERLVAVLNLIRAGDFSAPTIARKIGVSVPTVFRMIAALRSCGNDIRAEKTATGWRYVLASESSQKAGSVLPG